MITKFKKLLQPLSGAILSGILIGTSYIPFPPWALFFCLVPLWISILDETSAKKVFLKGWVSQFILSFIGFFWIIVVAHEHGHLPYAVSFLALFGFCATAMYYIPCSLVAWWWLKNKTTLQPGFQFALLVGVFWLAETFSGTIFPWNFGYPLIWGKLPMYQLADMVGFHGLSLVVLVFNLFFMIAWKQRNNKPLAGRIVGGVIGCFLILNILGWINTPNDDKDLPSINVLAIQANVGNQEKFYAQYRNGYQRVIMDRYYQLTQKALDQYQDERIDFILWPETAIPMTLGAFRQNGFMQQQLVSFLKKHKLPLVTGAYFEDATNKLISNTMLILDENGNLTDQVYKKTMLLAFGEYLPGGEIFPILKTWLPEVADFDRGHGPQHLLLKDLKLGPQICYEGLFPEFSAHLANQGADIFVNVTNDSWYGPYSEPYQHLYMTFAKSIEFRKPLIRSTNTGITTAITAAGVLQDKSPLFREWSHLFKIPRSAFSGNTLYQRTIWLIPSIVAVFLLILLALGWRAKNKNR